MAPRTSDCSCGNRQFGIIDQNGNPYDNGEGDIWTVPDYGPHPELQLVLDKCDPNTPAKPESTPFRLVADPNVENRFTLRWCAEQTGRNLIAADGETVLFTAPAETPFRLNGATNEPTTVGGLTVTPNGVAGHAPSAVLAISTENPPPFTVNGQGQIVGLDGGSGACMQFWPTEVSIADLEADPGAYQIDGKRTFVCVTNEETGEQSTYLVQNDTEGNPQEHHVA